jgi:hypothetical protein
MPQRVPDLFDITFSRPVLQLLHNRGYDTSDYTNNGRFDPTSLGYGRTPLRRPLRILPPLSPAIRKEANILYDIGVALHHQANWSTVPRGVVNLFSNVSENIKPALDLDSSMKTVIRLLVSGCSQAIRAAIHKHFTDTALSLLHQVHTPSPVCIDIALNRLKHKFKLCADFRSLFINFVNHPPQTNPIDVDSPPRHTNPNRQCSANPPPQPTPRLPTLPTRPVPCSSSATPAPVANSLAPATTTTTTTQPTARPARPSPPVVHRHKRLRSEPHSPITRPQVSNTDTNDVVLLSPSPLDHGHPINPNPIDTTPLTNARVHGTCRPGLPNHWTLDLGEHTKYLIIGDSNLRHLKVKGEGVQIDCYPGASLNHIHDLLSRGLEGNRLKHIFVHVGVNDRDNMFTETTEKKVTRLAAILKKLKVTHSFIAVPSSGNLNAYSLANIRLTNDLAKKVFFDFIPLPLDATKTDGIHLIEQAIIRLSAIISKRILDTEKGSILRFTQGN